MKLAGTGLFETIHPMTYLFVIKSIVFSIGLMLHLFLTDEDFIEQASAAWPEPMAYVWGSLVVIAGLIMMWFFYRDDADQSRIRIWTMAKVNMSLWVFSTVIWFAAGSWFLISISAMYALGYVYIGLADRFSRPHRV